MLNDLIERVKNVFTKPAPVEFAPPLSREKETAVCGYFDALTAYMHDPCYDKHVEVYKAHLASKEAK
jgi:hypothetical protein